MKANANSNVAPLEIVERIGAVYLGGAEAPGAPDQRQQTVQGLSPGREIKLPLMEGCVREPEVKLVIMSIVLSIAGMSCSGR